jgi:hypothetical protein
MRLATLVLGLALALAWAGCGGSAEAETPSATPTEVLSRYVAAVRAGDGAAVRDVLSETFVDHYDLDAKKIETSFIPAVRADLYAVGRSLQPAFERVLRDDLAVAALRNRWARPLPGPRAFAAPLILEDGGWKIEPFGVDMSSGYPIGSADLRRPFFNFGVNTEGDPKARLWVAGREIPLDRRSGRPITFEAQVTEPLPKGRHVVVAFAEVGDRYGVLAWTIRVR